MTPRGSWIGMHLSESPICLLLSVVRETCLETHGWVSKCCVNPRFVPCLVREEGCSAQCPPQVFFCYTMGFLKRLDISGGVIQMSLHESSAGIRILVKSTFQNLSPITLPKPAWLLQLNRRSDRRFYRNLITFFWCEKRGRVNNELP